MVPAKDFKRRMVVEIDGAPHMIEHIQVQTPSARGAATLYKIKARNLKTKTRVEKSYRGTDALNESSFWSGRPHDYNDTNAINYFPQIRDLVFAEKFQDAEKMADDHFWGIPKGQQAYEPIGDLLLKFDGADEVQDYRRELDMETGVAKVSYRVGDATFTREVFLSYPDRVMVVRISSDKPGRVSVQAQLKGPYLNGG